LQYIPVRTVVLIGLLFLIFPFPKCGLAAIASEETDCGARALFLLLRELGRDISLKDVVRILPAHRLSGSSMLELANASNRLGVPLEGITLQRNNKPLRASAIAFIESPPVGHFVYLRPVGFTGTLVQIIDPPRIPRIMDYNQLMSRKYWTGRILIPAKPWYQKHAMSLTLVGIALLLGITQKRRLFGSTVSRNLLRRARLSDMQAPRV
jgi:ABC-type bacteriocin/lantibiotic exporter with double-glycine peptidase domain